MLPPAGDAIVVRPHPASLSALREGWLPWRAHFFASGTAALAAGLVSAVARGGRSRPQVIVPGYACPALLSAVIHAGATPIYADLEPERPWMCLDALERLIGPDTVAVVAVNFLGIPERLGAIRRLTAPRGIVLVNDSAQAYPSSAPGLEADLVVVSFGRGKPVSLLGGGALLARDEGVEAALPRPPARHVPAWRLRAKALAYNTLRRPSVYWLPQMLPLGLGQTRYHPLAQVEAMDAERLAALPAAVEQFRARSRSAERAVGQAVGELAGLVDLPRVCGAGADPLSRYPLLAPDAASRDELLSDLSSRGLGASYMYGRSLPAVEGVPVGYAQARLPAAAEFAGRLLTLPIHDGVNTRHIEAIKKVLTRHCADLQPVSAAKA